MNNEDLRNKALSILSCQMDTLEEKEIQGKNAVYFRDTNRGGGALIIENDDNMLFVDPFYVDFDEHLRMFLNGERTHF